MSISPHRRRWLLVSWKAPRFWPEDHEVDYGYFVAGRLNRVLKAEAFANLTRRGERVERVGCNSK